MVSARLSSVFGLLTALACSGPPPPASVAQNGPRPDLGLRPGDAVRVDIWQEPDLTGEFLVAPSGTAVFPLIGEKEVAGKAPAEVEAELAIEYREFLENPSVKVTALRRIAILGEVRVPSLYMVDATINLTDALAMAGGILPTGNQDDIRLIRDGVTLVQSLDTIQAFGAMPIQSGDQIQVGQKSWLSRNGGVILGTITSLTIATLYILFR
jgi:protein involved in polysaccharide export with SLBB domain